MDAVGAAVEGGVDALVWHLVVCLQDAVNHPGPR